METKSYEELLAFVKKIARMTKDGDVLEDGEGGTYEYEADGNDDDVDAFYALITEARELTK